MNGGNEAPTGLVRWANPKPPTFSGNVNDNADAFLLELRQYFFVMAVPEEEQLDAMKSTLTDRAEVWYNKYKNQFRDFEEFSICFRGSFKSKDARRQRYTDSQTMVEFYVNSCGTGNCSDSDLDGRVSLIDHRGRIIGIDLSSDSRIDSIALALALRATLGEKELDRISSTLNQQPMPVKLVESMPVALDEPMSIESEESPPIRLDEPMPVKLAKPMPVKFDETMDIEIIEPSGSPEQIKYIAATPITNRLNRSAARKRRDHQETRASQGPSRHNAQRYQPVVREPMVGQCLPYFLIPYDRPVYDHKRENRRM